MSRIYRDGAIYLYGDVGDLWFEECFTAADVVEALSLHGSEKDITVHINSGGGIASEGSAIYSILAAHKGVVTVEVDGIAASAASIIAMAGETITMRLGSVMMVHDPSGYFMGYTEGDLEEAKRSLNAQATSMAQVYSIKTGRTVEQCREDMKSTLWLTPDEAVSMGYATHAGNDNALTAAAFDYSVYANVPEKLVALATDKNWRFKGLRSKAAASAANQPIEKEIDMTEKERADKLAAENEELKASVTKLTASLEETQGELKEMKSEREDVERKDAIAQLPEAQKRPKLAAALVEQGMNVESAKAVLTVSPEEAEEPAPAQNTAQQNYSQSRAAASAQAQPNAQGNSDKATQNQGIFAQALAKTNKLRK